MFSFFKRFKKSEPEQKKQTELAPEQPITQQPVDSQEQVVAPEVSVQVPPVVAPKVAPQIQPEVSEQTNDVSVPEVEDESKDTKVVLPSVQALRFDDMEDDVSARVAPVVEETPVASVEQAPVMPAEETVLVEAEAVEVIPEIVADTQAEVVQGALVVADVVETASSVEPEVEAQIGRAHV